MKVLLLNPPLKSDNPAEPIPFPLGVGYLASSLRTAGHDPVILDACLGKAVKDPAGDFYHIGLDQEEIIRRIEQEQPDVIGISVPFTSRLNSALQAGGIIRERVGETVPMIAGGMHATIDPAVFLQHGFDAVIPGEGEEVLIRYLNGLGKEELISGVVTEASDSHASTHNNQIKNLDSLPFPARDLVPFDQYLRRSGGRWLRAGLRVASVISSRGCPYRCTFCSAFRVAGHKYRRRSPENVLAEIEELIRQYKVEVIAFEDDNLTADRKRAVALFEGMAREFPRLQWITPNGVSIKDLDLDLLRLMKKAGCRSVNLAFESGDKRILQEAMKKDLDPEAGRQVRAWCRQAGIAVNGYFILGMPGETIESMERTRDFALAMDLDGIGIFIATPFPGTELFDLCLREGYLDDEYARGDTLFQCDPEVLHRPLIETPMLSKSDLLAFQRHFEADFRRNYIAHRPMARVKNLVMPILRKVGWGR